MEKKRFLVFLFAALLNHSSSASTHFANNITHHDSLLGSIPFNWKPTESNLGMPFTVLTTKDGRLLVTASGALSGIDNGGQIWKAGPEDKQLNIQKIKIETGQKYGEFTGSVLDPNDQDRFFICSNFVRMGENKKDINSVSKNGIVVISPPTVVVFQKNADGSYQWKKVINLAPEKDKESYCTRLVTSKGYLFALTNHNKGVEKPAIQYTLLSSTEKLPANLAVGATHSQLGFTEESEKFPVIDLAPALEEGKNDSISLFFLDTFHHAIGKALFTKESSGQLKFSQVTQRLHFSEEELPNPIALANYNDDSFIVSGTNEDFTPGGKLIQLTYPKNGKEPAEPKVHVIAEIPVSVPSLAIGRDRFGLTEDPVLFADRMQPIDDRYQVDEYRFETHLS